MQLGLNKQLQPHEIKSYKHKTTIRPPFDCSSKAIQVTVTLHWQLTRQPQSRRLIMPRP